MTSPEQTNDFTIDRRDLIVPVLRYSFEEVNNVLNSIRLPAEFGSPILTRLKAEELLEKGGYRFQDLDLPTDDRGYIDFDRLAEPIIERIAERNEQQSFGLAEFNYQYVTHGSQEAIGNIISEWVGKGTMTRLGVVSGDYVGYELEAASSGLCTDAIDSVTSLEDADEPIEGRIWFLSNPSAVDGNWINGEILEQFLNRGHKVVIDAAYQGLNPKVHQQNLEHPNILGYLESPSKIFGVFDRRYTGIAHTREEVTALMTKKIWFKSAPALFDTLTLYESFSPQELPTKYEGHQTVVCRAIGNYLSEVTQNEVEVTPSDTILMAYSDDELPPDFSFLAKAMGRYSFRLSMLFAQLDLHCQTEQ